MADAQQAARLETRTSTEKLSREPDTSGLLIRSYWTAIAMRVLYSNINLSWSGSCRCDASIYVYASPFQAQDA